MRWCRTMHSTVTWPMNGKYVCPRCLREYAVDWPARAGQPPLTSKFGVRTSAGMPVWIRGVPAVQPAAVPQKTLVRIPVGVALAASQRVKTPAPASTGIYVGGLEQRKPAAPFF